jgi:alpha-D-ribose 1-methylphosphonate 5-triphosphate synthase subunit PhnI
MGYETVRADSGAIAAAARLAQRAPHGNGASAERFDVAGTLPLLVDQVAGEAGVWEPAVCARALEQARGDVARAVSLVRAWAAMLPRREAVAVGVAEMRVARRITPAFREPEFGQFLGASLDYAQRLLDFDEDPPKRQPERNGEAGPVDGLAGTGAITPSGDQPDGAASANGGAPGASADTGARGPANLPRALDGLDREGLLDPGEPARPLDRTRAAADASAERGAFGQVLARGETGAMTAIAYTSIRGTDAAATLAELRLGALDVSIEHPVTGRRVRIGSVPATVAEVVLYGGRQKADGRLGVGVGATFGRVERRAISAAVLDANCAASGADPAGALSPSEDQEFLQIALDGQEATGFLEHLKLPHHVTFTSVLDRIVSGSDDGHDG